MRAACAVEEILSAVCLLACGCEEQQHCQDRLPKPPPVVSKGIERGPSVGGAWTELTNPLSETESVGFPWMSAHEGMDELADGTLDTDVQGHH